MINDKSCIIIYFMLKFLFEPLSSLQSHIYGKVNYILNKEMYICISNIFSTLPKELILYKK